LQQQFQSSAQRGADWLSRMNGVKGKFLPGWLPALNAPLDGDSVLRQAGAAFALARAAQFFRDERYVMRAAQAILTLLEDTELDPKDPQVRYSSHTPLLVNPLGFAALLVLAIHELPQPDRDLLDKAEQLCNYLRRQQHDDGSLDVQPRTKDRAQAGAESGGESPGMALYALARSQKLRPTSWKLETVRRALPFYVKWWREHKDAGDSPCGCAAWYTAAYTEAFLATKEQPFADAVHEMNEWLCGLQYESIDDARRARWFGGFRTSESANPRNAFPAPTVASAVCAESLAHACRVTREEGDVKRHERFSNALGRSLQFLTTLQYTEATTQHFADWYREQLLGGFAASHQDGNLRIDQTQHALSALVLYLQYDAK
jgi:hypothetical protein